MGAALGEGMWVRMKAGRAARIWGWERKAWMDRGPCWMRGGTG